MKTVLSIAGTDPSGGAGNVADIKTMSLNGVYAMSVITALVAQNTTGVKKIEEVPPDFLRQQLEAVFEDIFPDAVKIGMVSAKELIHVIAKELRLFEARHIVLDPVMVATAGSALINDDAVQAMTEELIPIAELVTPNIPEAEVLSGMKIENREDMQRAAERLEARFGCAVLLKGGHSVNDANDLLCKNGVMRWYSAKRIDTPNTHGTGCTLSSAIAANLAKGFSTEEAVGRAKEYLLGAISAQPNLGHGKGPIGHCFNLCGKFAEEADENGFK